MNLSENLKKIRKENNLSQEQLAEKLGVSRQSVSKWESGLAYPEMDKMLQLCKIFNLNIDELLNQDIKEINNNKQSKNNINKFIDDFLDYITTTIGMFSSMKLKEKFKCLFEQFIIIVTIMIILLIIGTFGSNVLQNLLSFLPNNIYYPIYNIFEALYIASSLILTLILVLYIFKIRYLDYYIIVKEDSKQINEIEQNKKIDEEIKKNKIIIENKKEKVVIRDPKHSGYKFISGLLRCLLVFLKFIVGSIGIVFCFSLILFVICIVISFTFSKATMFFIGVLLCLTACIIINLIVLALIYNFIVSRKNKKDKIAITFLSSLIILGLGIGNILIGISKMEFVSIADSDYYITEERKFEMTDNLFFESYSANIEYIKSDNSDIKVKYTYFPIYEINFINTKEGYYITKYLNDYNEIEMIKRAIDDFNNNKIVNYSDFKIYIYTNEENIKQLKQNVFNY